MRDAEIKNLIRPTGLSLEAINHGIFGDLVTTVQSGQNPVWPKGDGTATVYPYLQSFSFKQDGSRSLIIFNLHRTDSLKVKINLPADPGKPANYYVLTSANIDDNNEIDEKVKITLQSLPSAKTYELTLRPFSLNVIVWGEK